MSNRGLHPINHLDVCQPSSSLDGELNPKSGCGVGLAYLQTTISIWGLCPVTVLGLEVENLGIVKVRVAGVGAPACWPLTPPHSPVMGHLAPPGYTSRPSAGAGCAAPRDEAGSTLMSPAAALMLPDTRLAQAAVSPDRNSTPPLTTARAAGFPPYPAPTPPRR